MNSKTTKYGIATNKENNTKVLFVDFNGTFFPVSCRSVFSIEKGKQMLENLMKEFVSFAEFKKYFSAFSKEEFLKTYNLEKTFTFPTSA